MKSFKKWLFTLMSAFMLLGAATACSNASKTDDPNTEETDDSTQNDGSQTEEDSNSGQ
ncbi:hypothetical protein [Neobacillus vireti]|uniref:hypothetical protein n=1 Tax=Neobacillus vireti TaxID=220686 RepID=UPI0004149DB3|nr:hypothetical protein [Neobacillus vireti]